MSAPLVPAKRTVTDTRKVTFSQLFDALGIFNGGQEFTEVHITVQASPSSKTRGSVIIVTKVETEVP